MKNGDRMLSRVIAATHSRHVRNCFAVAFTCFALMTSACADSSDPPVSPASRTLTGNWGSPGFTNGSMSLVETNGHITGFGWVTEGSTAATFDGTRNGADVLLTGTLVTRGNITFKFHGEFNNDVLVGDIFESLRVSLARVDTVATGIADITYSDLYARKKEDARFSVIGNQLTLRINTSYPPLIIEGPISKLVKGKYPIGLRANDTFSVRFDAANVNPSFESVSGEITIEVATKRALIGSFVAHTVSGSRPLDISGTFSAGCALDPIDKNLPGCLVK